MESSLHVTLKECGKFIYLINNKKTWDYSLLICSCIYESYILLVLVENNSAAIIIKIGWTLSWRIWESESTKQLLDLGCTSGKRSALSKWGVTPAPFLSIFFNVAASLVRENLVSTWDTAHLLYF